MTHTSMVPAISSSTATLSILVYVKIAKNLALIFSGSIPSSIQRKLVIIISSTYLRVVANLHRQDFLVILILVDFAWMGKADSQVAQKVSYTWANFRFARKSAVIATSLILGHFRYHSSITAAWLVALVATVEAKQISGHLVRQVF